MMKSAKIKKSKRAQVTFTSLKVGFLGFIGCFVFNADPLPINCSMCSYCNAVVYENFSLVLIDQWFAVVTSLFSWLLLEYFWFGCLQHVWFFFPCFSSRWLLLCLCDQFCSYGIWQFAILPIQITLLNALLRLCFISDQSFLSFNV